MAATDDIRFFTPVEAAVVSGVALKRVNNAIDKRLLKTDRGSGAYEPRRLYEADLLLLKIWAKASEVLTDDRRATLMAALDSDPAPARVKLDALVTLELSSVRREIRDRIRDLDAANAMIDKKRSVMGGEAVFKGTRIPVRSVVALLDAGATPEQLIEDYPQLDRKMIELARLWVAAHPARGRPRSLSDRGATYRGEKRAKLAKT